MALCKVKIEDLIKCAECNEFKEITYWNITPGICEIRCTTVAPCKFNIPIKEE